MTMLRSWVWVLGAEDGDATVRVVAAASFVARVDEGLRRRCGDWTAAWLVDVLGRFTTSVEVGGDVLEALLLRLSVWSSSLAPKSICCSWSAGLRPRLLRYGLLATNLKLRSKPGQKAPYLRQFW